MSRRISLREAGGWMALGAAGVVAIAIAVWLFSRDDAAVTADGADGGSQRVDESSLGPIGTRAPEVGSPAPDFALLDARDGITVRKLSDYRGKTVVLNWFATWCGPCRAEMPDFEAAYEALGGADGDVVFLLVNLQETSDQALGLLSELGVTYPAVLDSRGSVADLYRIPGMPTTFFIDRDGIVRNFGSGRVTAETLKRELESLGHQY